MQHRRTLLRKFFETGLHLGDCTDHIVCFSGGTTLEVA